MFSWFSSVELYFQVYPDMKQDLSCSLRQQWKCEHFPFRTEILLEQIQTCHQSRGGCLFVPGMMMVCVCVRGQGVSLAQAKEKGQLCFLEGLKESLSVLIPQETAVANEAMDFLRWDLCFISALLSCFHCHIWSQPHCVNVAQQHFFQSLLKTFIKMSNSKLHFHYFQNFTSSRFELPYFIWLHRLFFALLCFCVFMSQKVAVWLFSSKFSLETWQDFFFSLSSFLLNSAFSTSKFRIFFGIMASFQKVDCFSSGILLLAWRVCTSVSTPDWAVLLVGEMGERSGGPRCCWLMTSACCWAWGSVWEPCWTSAIIAVRPSAPNCRFDCDIALIEMFSWVCSLPVQFWSLTMSAGQHGDVDTLWWGRRGWWRGWWRSRETSERSDPPVQPFASCTGSPHRLLQGHTWTGVCVFLLLFIIQLDTLQQLLTHYSNFWHITVTFDTLH